MELDLLYTQDDPSQDYLHNAIILKALAVTKTLLVPPTSSMLERATSRLV